MMRYSKHYFVFALGFAAACGAFVGCDDDDAGGSPPPPKADAASDVTSSDVTVAADVGPVVGTVQPTGVRAFLGIPYAAAPVGARRWKAPAEARWSEPRAAKAFGPRCFGVSLLDSNAVRTGASEDCLSLNIWAPPGGSGPKAVVFWIHGGGLVDGTGADYDGAALAHAGDVVVVSINYRLGALGSLALSSSDGGGNLSLLDQQFALQWVHRNIVAFGGDPSRVTLAGESAGGQFACTHAAMPSSQGLFSALLTESSSCDGTRTPDQAAAAANALAKSWGCAENDAGSDAGAPLDEACLRALPPETIVRGNQAIGVLPIVDGQLLPETPRAAMAAGRFAKVPVLAGFNANEGFFFTDGQMGALPLSTPSDYTTALGMAFGPLGPMVEKEYPLSSYGSDPRTAMAAVMGDASAECPTRKLIASSTAPVFAYLFSHATKLASPKPVQAMHTIELPYVWGTPLPWTWWQEERPGVPTTDKELELAARVKRHWANFIKAHDPSDSTSAAWPAWSSASPNAMVFSEDPSVAPLPVNAHCAFWESLYGG
ncbi:carboxylesterase family protein [Pendulispora brunnea]|uniref:Carboxylic ester hydrolase n=1 Tax=Pendulispora brunnea TaxID=2905690 RepID=A0ABZ2KJS5_9BACT